MTSQCGEEGTVPGVPKLDGVVETGASDVSAVRGKSDMVDLFLVTGEASDVFCTFGYGVPKVDQIIVACADEAFDDAAVDRG